MSLTLYFHPLSSFCQKALIALYELEVPFEKRVVDLGDARDRAAFLEVWPLGKFPVVRDETRGITVPETSIIIEYVQRRHAPSSQLIPSDPDRAHVCRLRDRFFDLYVDVPMGKIVTDKLRPEGAHDPLGVEQARSQLETAYSIADEWLREGPWAVGDTFTMADCAAAPALFYANEVAPFARDPRWTHLAAYWARLAERPSYARVANEAKPYMSMFPG
ncbi:MAG TPA: glutathione S-transferase family protein [Polyangiaceae bacterium]|nr:glutathione S-transferase family protein [Polyangiaceae bacterium]